MVLLSEEVLRWSVTMCPAFSPSPGRKHKVQISIGCYIAGGSTDLEVMEVQLLVE